MAGVPLKDLLASQLQLSAKEGKKQATERISIEEFRKLASEAQGEALKQTEILTQVNTTLKDEKVIQLSQQAEEAKANSIAAQVSKDTTAVNTNIEKLLKETIKQNKSMQSLLQQSKKAQDVLDKARKEPERKTLGEKLQGVKQMFTPKGILRAIEKKADAKGGILGGIISNIAGGKADQMQRAEDIKILNPGMSKKESIAKSKQQLKQQAEARREDRASPLEGIRARTGMTDKQIAGSPGGKQLLGDEIRTAKKFEKASVASLSKTAEKEQSSKVEKQKKKATASKEEKDSKIDKRKEVSALDFSDESDIETNREIAKQTELLTKIEENTRTGAVAEEAKPKQGGKSMLGGLIESIGSMLSGGLMKAAKFLFNPRMILKLIGKVFLPAMIIGSVVNGLIDGFKVFFSGGTFVEAVIAGLGGMLDFLTFGLIDAKTIQSIVDFVSGFVEDYIVKPIEEFVQTISDAFENYIMKPIEEFLSPLTNFFKSIKDSIMNFVTGFEIPGISFTIPVINKEVEFGPWKPFGEATAKVEPASTAKASTVTADTAAATAPPPAEANAVYNRSADNATAANDNKQAAPVIVNAPTSINNSQSSQNVTMPAPIRNNDSGFSGYIRKAAVFV